MSLQPHLEPVHPGSEASGPLVPSCTAGMGAQRVEATLSWLPMGLLPLTMRGAETQPTFPAKAGQTLRAAYPFCSCTLGAQPLPGASLGRRGSPDISAAPRM